jgi:hypothetical protein
MLRPFRPGDYPGVVSWASCASAQAFTLSGFQPFGEQHECDFGPKDPSAESKQKNTCRSYGALAAYAARVAINMALLTELFAWQSRTLRRAKDACKAAGREAALQKFRRFPSWVHSLAFVFSSADSNDIRSEGKELVGESVFPIMMVRMG